ncbi:MAG: type II toxin-antitoxin system RelE/ParE family toxin [Verrucomicrobiales bacterium]|jgi:mRNA-degrading endonuclease RelE of RelBE toxin-antitoxin system|nr:type II toxin-antitoxin system RelE/ParE family toxin [Verrucomicrobiales bacterium]
MPQIIFTPVSSAEMSALPKMLQLEILSEFQVLTPDFLDANPDKFGVVRDGQRVLYRYRAKDYRIYFEKTDGGLGIQRVLHKNSLKDFFFRSKLPVSEDEELQGNPAFWALIDAPEKKPE